MRADIGVVLVVVADAVIAHEVEQLRRGAVSRPCLLILGHGVRVIAVVIGVAVGGMRLTEGINTPIFAVYIQNRVLIILCKQRREALYRQLMHEHVTHMRGECVLLRSAQQHG